MKQVPTGSPENRWKDLYIAALFENDKSRMAPKIVEAQQAIVARRQKSLMSGTKMSGTSSKERQALDTALLSLQALANCLATTPNLVADVQAAVQSVDVRAA